MTSSPIEIARALHLALSRWVDPGDGGERTQ
jgi:hypothetical protein